VITFYLRITEFVYWYPPNKPKYIAKSSWNSNFKIAVHKPNTLVNGSINQHLLFCSVTTLGSWWHMVFVRYGVTTREMLVRIQKCKENESEPHSSKLITNKSVSVWLKHQTVYILMLQYTLIVTATTTVTTTTTTTTTNFKWPFFRSYQISQKWTFANWWTALSTCWKPFL